MANRHVFKIWGSIGPAGSLVSLTEKFCTNLFPQAYKHGDPEQFESQIDKDLKVIRDDYILQLFNFKSKFEKKKDDENERDKAYDDLIAIIKQFIEKSVRLERNKYMRERIYYQRTNQIVMYENSNKMYQSCRTTVVDNLVKTAKTICNPTKQEFEKHFKDFNIEENDDKNTQDDIKSRISFAQADEYLSSWRKIQSDYSDELSKLR